MEKKKFNQNAATTQLPKIFCFIHGVNNIGCFPVALAEDGEALAGHCSSNVGFARHDIGFTSDWKHDEYSKHYPNGYELVWLDDNDRKDAEFLQACENNSRLAPKEDE
jgi:hypothetical protein